MEDIEHSQHDRECFIYECEERNPLPPSPAGVGDSSMSDERRCSGKARHIDQTARGFMEADHPTHKGPPHCEGPPVDYHWRKHSVGGIENVLAGSEEDTHLESVNTFFERRRRLAGPGRLAEPGQEGLEEQGEIILEKEPWSRGPQASNSDLPKTVAVLNPLPARSETALGTDATQTAKGNISINTMNKDGSDCETAPERADGSSRAETNKLINPEAELLIGEDWPMTTAAHELRQHSQYRGPSHDFICLENTLGSGRSLSSQMCKRLLDTDYRQPSLNMETLGVTVEVATEEKLQKVNINLVLPGLNPNSLNGNKRPQSDYSRKNRKKKKRRSALLEGSGHRGQLRAESEKRQSALGAGMDLRSAKKHSDICVNEKHISDRAFAGSPPSTDAIHTSRLIENPSDDIYPLTQRCHVPDNLDRLGFSTDSISDQQCNTLHRPPAHPVSHKSFSTHGQHEDSVAPSQAYRPSQQNESTGSTLSPGSLTLASVCERSFLSGDDTDHVGTLQQSYEMKHSLTNGSCKSGRKSHCYGTEVNCIANSISQSGDDSNDHMSKANQNDDEANREESCLVDEMGFPGRDNPAEGQRDALHSQKLKIDCHRAAQLSSADLLRSTIVMIGSDSRSIMTMDAPLFAPQSYGGPCSTEPSKYEGNVADTSANTVADISANMPHGMDTDERDKAINEVGSLEASQDTSKLEFPTEEPDATSETVQDVSNAPDSKKKVFAISSFWNEMESLTIKDILASRMESMTPPPQTLSPLAESEETPNNNNNIDTVVPDVELATINSASSARDDASFSSLDVLWEAELRPVGLGAGQYPENMMLMTSDPDNPQPLLSTGNEEGRYRRMMKNTSVRNLHALDSEPFSLKWKVQASVAGIPQESEEAERECYPDVQKPCCDFTEGTPVESYRISLTDIFQYIFGGKQSKPPKPPYSEDIDTHYGHGNTVPETYDQFFSEFDFFNPLVETEDRPKDQPVPIFSRSRSSSRYLQFPEAYDHFLSSSSSDDDDSSTESEEDDLRLIRVVTRFSPRTTEAQTATDIYENFFADWGLCQNLFWNTTFSLRNVRLGGPVRQNQQSSGPLTPVDQSSVQRRRRVFKSINALGNQDTEVPDPLLYHFEERVYRQLSRHPFSFDDLQSLYPSEPVFFYVNVSSFKNCCCTMALDHNQLIYNSNDQRSFPC